MCGITGFWNIAISRAQLARVLKEEALRWYQEETYFTECPDPNCGKRGRKFGCISLLLPKLTFFAWTRWVSVDLFHIMTYETNH